MKKFKYQMITKCKAQSLLTGLLLAVVVPYGTLFAAGLEPVNLGSTARFAILAGAEVTSTGSGVIHGDVGAYPIAGSGIGIPAPQVIGTIYTSSAGGPAGSVVDPARLIAAQGDLTVAYNDAAGRTPAPTGSFLNPGGGNIGGLNLVPGLYKFTSQALISGTDVTLTGGPNDVWIFQIASDLLLESGIKVILAGGAQARNIFWQVGTSAVLQTGSTFKGTIMADQAITMMTGSTTDGRALARIAGVTFNGVGGSLPAVEAPAFTDISKATSNSTTVVLSTTPYFLLTLEGSPNLLLTNSWNTIATNIPVSTPVTFITDDAMATQRYYRAFITQD